jgi:energy-converting hydrogenase A subunit H
MITGDLFNFILFVALIGIVNIGIVSAVKQISVLDAAFHYGLIAMMSSLPLFGGGAMILASTGTLSLFALSQIPHTSLMLLFATIMFGIGVAGETGIAPFFATKAEMFRTPGSPFILIIHLSSLFIIIRTIEIILLIVA